MLSSGLVASLEALQRGIVVAVSAVVLLAGGAAVALRASRAPRPMRSGGPKADLFIFGLALAVGGTVELLHALNLLFGNAPHLGLAASLAAGAAWLLTGHNRGFKVEARVTGALRLAGVLLVVSAGSLFVAVGIGEPHGRVTDVSMLVLAASGLVLIRAGVRTPAVGWQRL
jgi:hypothetical protein